MATAIGYAAPGDLPGSAWQMTVNGRKTIGCTPSQQVCANIKASVDGNGRIHLTIKHLGNTYDYIVASSVAPNEGAAIAWAEAQMATQQGLTIDQ